MDHFKQGKALTLFLPVDQAWDTVDEIEKLYLESEFAEEDLHWKTFAIEGDRIVSNYPPTSILCS